MPTAMRAQDPQADTVHVSLRGIGKRFGGAHALRDVDLDITRGSIHGLVGENGAGKSTLGKIVTGVHRPDAGHLRVDGREAHYRSPREALDDGLVLIAQELALVPQLTPTQNILLGVERHRMGVLSDRSMREQLAELHGLGFELPPDVPVGRLRTAEQQKVEIMRAVARDARLIVMDEPTASLTRDEAERLFAVMRAQAARGTTIVFVSHALEDVLDLCDTVTILRDGRHVRTAPAAEETVGSLVHGMIGHSLDTSFPPRHPADPSAPVVLEVEDLAVGGWVEGVSLQVRAGEILGIAGLIGSGRSEVARAIFGADRADRGSVRLDGRPVRFRGPRQAIAAGVALVPESRKEQGLVMVASARENISLPHLGDLQRAGVVRRRRERAEAYALCERVDVRQASIDAPVRNLSGGNQQKVLFAKWLCRTPRVLIVDEPTRGVDVGAKRAIYDLISSLAADGVAVIVVSSELEEVLGLAHRVLVMRRGRVAGELADAEATEHEVLRLAFGADDSFSTERGSTHVS